MKPKHNYKVGDLLISTAVNANDGIWKVIELSKHDPELMVVMCVDIGTNRYANNLKVFLGKPYGMVTCRRWRYAIVQQQLF